MKAYLIVFFGAGIGGVLRYGVNVAALRLLGPTFPYGTLTVNIVGSFIMGMLAGYFALKADPGQT
jgi:CrcB protein